jgi:hypothetical protein
MCPKPQGKHLMKTRRILFLTALLWLTAFCAGTLLSQDPNQPPPPPQPPPLQQGVEVEARGPVHEAFAEPTAPRPEAAEIVPKQPPNPVEEMPPDQKPEGANVAWIPGYWAWDDGSNDYVWVSGCWRDVPPNQTWVSGHWQEVQGGWQWAPGFWANAQQQQLQYVPPPPPSIDTGPTAPAPADNTVYVPGCWVYQETRFLWRPGFWIPYQPDWVWIPAHYVWSPGGCVFLEGYWDHPLHVRGLLFAPVRLARAILLRRDWVFEPQYCVEPDFLIGALFIRPASHHYFFGDYFEQRYVQRGFVPWIDYRVAKVGYDPNFAYYRHAFARDKAWETNLRALYTARLRGDVPRPPTTLVQQHQVINQFTVNNSQNVTVNKTINITNIQNVRALAPVKQVNNLRVTALASLAHAQGAPAAKVAANIPIQHNVIKLATVTQPQRIEERKRATQIREVAVQRQKAEAGLLASGTHPVKHTDPPRPFKIDLPKLAAHPPLTQPAAGKLPEGKPPATQPPAGKPPVTQPPAGKPPEGKPPVTQPPAGKPPATQPPPTGKPPEGKPPVTQPPTGKPPVTQPPAGKPPATQPPAGKPPAQSTVRTPPPPPAVPKHVEQPIPKHEPLKPSQPPSKAAKPPPPKQSPPQALAPARRDIIIAIDSTLRPMARTEPRGLIGPAA